MSMFWLFSVVLALLALIFIALPAFKFRKASQALISASEAHLDEDRQRQNVRIFKERLLELESDLQAEKINASQFEELKEELELALLADVEDDNASSSHALASYSIGLSFVCALLVIGASYWMYFELGSYEQVNQRQAMMFNNAERQQAQQAAQQGDMNGLLNQLYSKLQDTPDNLEGWMLLSRTAMNLEKFDLAVEGYETIIRALEKRGENPAAVYGLLAQAQYFGQTNAGVLSDEVTLALNKALSLDPEETNALGLYAIHYFDTQDYASAITYWERVLTAVPDHPARDSIESGIARAKSLAGMPTDSEAVSQAAPLDRTEVSTENSNEGAQIGVTVSLDPSLIDQADPNDIVFIFARAESGPPMPLAASRLRVADLPVTITLDDSKAMAPMAKLSQVERANIIARVSKSGQPIAQAGDLEGRMENVPVWEQKKVAITIDTQL